MVRFQPGAQGFKTAGARALLALQTTDEGTAIRRLTAQASRYKDPDKAREAALKAWRTIRLKRRLESKRGYASVIVVDQEKLALPPGVASSTFKATAPLIKHSKLTQVSKGGVGKQLSDGWALNFSIGCTMGCKFCYVDEIHKKWGEKRAGDIVYNDWGDYLSLPSNLQEAIDETHWNRWKGQEVMLSSTHDPYLPVLFKWTRKILEAALPEGVKFCIQTRSPLVEKDLDLLRIYRKQVRLQVSIATYNSELSRNIETRVVPPERRMQVLEAAKAENVPTGIIIAPILPPVKLRQDVEDDLGQIAADLKKIRPGHIYGESIHVRGINQAYVEKSLGEPLKLAGFDKIAEAMFHKVLKRSGMRGIWWPEYDSMAQ
jgi:DNA repair photolyase